MWAVEHLWVRIWNALNPCFPIFPRHQHKMILFVGYVAVKRKEFGRLGGECSINNVSCFAWNFLSGSSKNRCPDKSFHLNLHQACLSWAGCFRSAVRSLWAPSTPGHRGLGSGPCVWAHQLGGWPNNIQGEKCAGRAGGGRTVRRLEGIRTPAS